MVRADLGLESRQAFGDDARCAQSLLDLKFAGFKRTNVAFKLIDALLVFGCDLGGLILDLAFDRHCSRPRSRATLPARVPGDTGRRPTREFSKIAPILRAVPARPRVRRKGRASAPREDHPQPRSARPWRVRRRRAGGCDTLGFELMRQRARQPNPDWSPTGHGARSVLLTR